MNSYWKPLQASFVKVENLETAKKMKNYMKGQFEYYGIKQPERKQLEKEFYLQNPIPNYNQMEALVLDAWKQPYREWKYVALSFFEKYKKQWKADEINLIEKLIQTDSWWDTVDMLATKYSGFLLKKYPDLVPDKPNEWIQSNDLWLKRSALLFQLHYKSKTDFPLLKAYIYECLPTKEFFLQKAIGWTLRQYSKIEPAIVVDFIEKNPLPPLSMREGLKWVRKENLY